MAKLNGFRKLVKWMREGDDFRKASTWTSAQSVEMADGTTVEEKLSNLNTIEYAETAGVANSVEWTNVKNAPIKSVEYKDGVLTITS